MLQAQDGIPLVFGDIGQFVSGCNFSPEVVLASETVLKFSIRIGVAEGNGKNELIAVREQVVV